MEILIVGDTLTDRSFYCLPDGISPEAPIPKWKVKRKEDFLGGAGNVALILNNISNQSNNKVNITFLSLLDKEQEILSKRMTEIDVVNLAKEDYKGIIKNRIIFESPYRQVSRFDEDSFSHGDITIPARISRKRFDVALVSDYGKGLISKDMMRVVRHLSDFIVLDPYPDNLECYTDLVDIITPNKNELNSLVNAKEKNSIQQQSWKLKNILSLDGRTTVIAKLGKLGCLLYKDEPIHIRAWESKRPIIDSMGAGDVFISSLVWSLIMGMSLIDSTKQANLTAGWSVSEPGCWTFQK